MRKKTREIERDKNMDSLFLRRKIREICWKIIDDVFRNPDQSISINVSARSLIMKIRKGCPDGFIPPKNKRIWIFCISKVAYKTLRNRHLSSGSNFQQGEKLKWEQFPRKHQGLIFASCFC